MISTDEPFTPASPAESALATLTGIREFAAETSD
jgi:hypothetical protein